MKEKKKEKEYLIIKTFMIKNPLVTLLYVENMQAILNY